MKGTILKLVLVFVFAVAVGLGTYVVQNLVTAPPTEPTVLSEAEDADTSEQTEENQQEKASPNAEEFTQVDEASDQPEEAAERPAINVANPVELAIPSIDVQADLEDVGVLDNGQMGVPESAEGVGWFEPGVAPGEQGNAVMAGHVDSTSGPAVFFDLDEMEAGDDVHVTNADGQELTFTVEKVVSYPREEAPMEAIFGASDSQNLQLITCTGTFNQEQGTHDERLVVYTELTEESEEALPSD